MARYTDLDPLDYFGSAGTTKLLAVGWIESAEQCIGGEVDRGFFEALADLLVDPWQPVVAAGMHRCTLCRFTGGPSTVHVGARAIAVGANNMFVFGDDRVYVAPSTIVHYIDAHGYGPPVEFQVAVRRSPAMRSMDYLRLVQRHGLHRMA